MLISTISFLVPGLFQAKEYEEEVDDQQPNCDSKSSIKSKLLINNG